MALPARLTALLKLKVPYYTRLALYLQAGIIVAAAFVLQWWPLVPGVAIGVLACVAAVLVFEFTRLEKTVWIVFVLGVFALESHAIYKDRADHDAEQASLRAAEDDARRKENAAFAELLKEEQSIFDQSKALTNLSERNIDTLTGGDSFCYVFMNIDNTVGLQPLLMRKGKYHVFDITVRIVDLEAFHRAAGSKLLLDRNRYEQDFGPIPILQRGQMRVLGTTRGCQG